MNPLVSICCITFNHKNFISNAIEGFLMQKTLFPFEIIIHDDASTDGTTEIIKSYEKKYPDLIKPIYQKENQWSQGIKPSPTYVWPRAKGKYIALCEGDDYWTDPLKLQKQVDFLEENEIYSIHHHAYRIRNENGEIIGDGNPRSQKFNLDDYLSGKANGMPQTCTMLFRNSNNISELSLNNGIYLCDTTLVSQLLKNGSNAYYSKEKMAVYRKHTGGVWSLAPDYKRNIHKQKVFESLILLNYNNKHIYRTYELLLSTNLKLMENSSGYRSKFNCFFKSLKILFCYNYLSKAIATKDFVLRYIKLYGKTIFHFIKPSKA